MQNSGPSGLHFVPHKYHRSNLADRLQAVVPIPSNSVPVRVVLGSVKKASHWAISTAVRATFTSIQSKAGQNHPEKDLKNTVSNETPEDFVHLQILRRHLLKPLLYLIAIRLYYMMSLSFIVESLLSYTFSESWCNVRCNVPSAALDGLGGYKVPEASGAVDFLWGTPGNLAQIFFKKLQDLDLFGFVEVWSSHATADMLDSSELIWTDPNFRNLSSTS